MILFEERGVMELVKYGEECALKGQPHAVQYLTLLGASWLSQSMYSPVLMVDCYMKTGQIMSFGY